MTLIYWIKRDVRLQVCQTLGLPLWETVNGKTVISDQLTDHQRAELERMQNLGYLHIQDNQQ